MTPKSWFLFAYDVRDDRRLRKVAKTLEGAGTRLQYSVFRSFLSKTEMERLRWQLTELMDPVDSLLILPLCSSCIARARNLNERATWPDDPTGPIIV